MKPILILSFVSCALANQRAVGSCAISFTEITYNEWHDITEGIIYALYANPPHTLAGCLTCDTVGKKVAGISEAIARLESAREEWTSQTTIDSRATFDRIRFLNICEKDCLGVPSQAPALMVWKVSRATTSRRFQSVFRTRFIYRLSPVPPRSKTMTR